GERAVAHRRVLEAAGLPPMAALATDRDPLAPGDAVAYALAAAAEALADAGLADEERSGAAAASGVERDPIEPERVAVSVGTTLGEIAPWLDVVRGRPQARDRARAFTW